MNASKEKNGIVPIMGRVTINGSVAQFSCKRTIAKELWDVKGNRAKSKSKEARELNLALDNIKAQIIKHYQRLSEREAFVTAEMVRNAYQGIGTEYETLLGAFDKDNATFKKRVGTDRVMATYMSRVRARNHVAAFIKANYKRNDMSMIELTPDFIGEPAPDDKESFQIGGRWFKPNYHAHIVFDWMDHDTGKSRKLNDDDMMQMQTLASDILSMERGQSKTVTGKEHLERNDFIIEKQRAELERIEAERQHKEHQIDIAEQELKQVKSEIRTDKLKSVATDAATALASGVSSLFGSGKMKSLERKNEDLRDEIAIRDETIEQLQSNIKQMQVEHIRAMMNKENEHRKVLEAKEAEHKEETNTLNSIINTAHRWYPDFANLLRLERLAKQIGLSAMEFAELIKGKVLNFTGRLFSSEHNRWFATDNTPLQILRDNDRRLTLTANRIPISQWFCKQYDKLKQSIRQPI